VDAEQPFGRIRRLRESFEEWHRLGMSALQRGDAASFNDAIQAHAAIIREQMRMMDELALSQQSPRV